MALDNVAHLTWNANSEPDLAGYKVYAGNTPGVFIFSTAVGNVTSFTFGPPLFDFLNDGKWYFAITAYDTSNNESAFSSVVSKRIIRVLAHFITRK